VEGLVNKKPVNQAHLLLERHLRELYLDFRAEWQFHPLRKWRFDYVLGDFVGRDWEPDKLAIEIEGGIWMGKGHTGGKHFQSDLDKYNQAVMLGWRVLRFSTEDVLRGRAKAFLAEHLGGK
jgi:very-short-patch-repair endonuclease